MKNIEILSPAGDMEKLKAALIGGADAVYLAGEKFGARKYSGNFTKDELIEAIEYAHLRDKKVYVTVNTLFFDDELNQIYSYIQFLNNNHVDGIIIQDLAVVDYINNNFKDLEIHASTQMSIHSKYGAKWAKNNGFNRIVLARENTIEEVGETAKIIDTEIFIHGAHCISYSGQCLMSSLIGGRSGNRGSCAQPCRKKYQLIGKDGKIISDIDGKYLLSPKDMYTLNDLDIIKKSGAMSLKIEGRMKNKYYAFATAHEYKQSLTHKPIEYSSEIIFNRQYTKGRLFSADDADFMNFNSPENYGSYLGRVVAYNNRIITIDSDRKLYKGDEVKVFRSNNSIGGRIEDIISGNQYRINSRYEFKKGEMIYTTFDTNLINRIEERLNNEERLISLNIFFSASVSSGVRIELKCQGIKIELCKNDIAQSSKNISITKNDVEKQLNKLGDTVYFLNEFSTDIDDNVFIRKSDINELRREAISLLNVERNKRYENAIVSEIKVENEKIKNEYIIGDLIVEVSNIDQLRAVDLSQIKKVYYSDTDTLIEAYNYNENIIPILPEISKDADFIVIDNILKKLNKVETIMVRTLGQYEYFKGKYTIESDFTFNITNQMSCNKLIEMGIKKVTLSEELSMNQIKLIAENSNIDTGVTIYGYQRAMITEYCIYRAIDKCEYCKLSGSYLKDEKDYEFPLMRAYGCRMKILNSRCLNLIRSMDELKQSNLNQYRLRFTIEEAELVKDIINRFYLVFYENAKITLQSNQYTTGHFVKGVQR